MPTDGTEPPPKHLEKTVRVSPPEKPEPDLGGVTPLVENPDGTAPVFVPGRKVFDRYLLKRILGRGGMGVVWLAWDETLERETAIKFLPEVVWRNQESIAELRRETKRNLDLTHPNIVRIYDILEDPEEAGISMEYVDGGALSDRKLAQPQGCFRVPQIASWIGQLCAGLDYAHGQAKIVHLDLKPANLLVNARGQLKITDFGIACSISETVRRTSMFQQTSGTLAYMSPQRLNGDRPGPLDDVYGLGATIYELLTSKPPFYSGDLIRQVEKKVPLSMAAQRAELGIVAEPIPALWEETVAACLAKNPAQRPQSVAEAAHRLGLSTAAFPGKSVRPGSRRRPGVLAMAATAALLLGGLSFYFNSEPTGGDLRNRHNLATAGEPGKTTAPKPVIKDGPVPGQPYTNTLGMRFVAVPGANVYYSIWETRVQDFEAFVNAKGYNATREFVEFGSDGWKRITGHSWKEPGFPQGPTHAVCGVSWFDAQRFCEWLTEQERSAGRLKENQSYRLPTEAEWDQAVGTNRYHWGNEWPLPPDAGNYAGQEVLADGNWKVDDENATLADFNDHYSRTAPVGSFRAINGLYDLGGNVWEWCQDTDDSPEKRVQRGASWHNGRQASFEVNFRGTKNPSVRDASSGFRCVLEGVAP